MQIKKRTKKKKNAISQSLLLVEQHTYYIIFSHFIIQTRLELARKYIGSIQSSFRTYTKSAITYH